MLSMSTYPQDYIDSCRRLVDSQLASYRALVAATGEPGGDRAGLDAAVADFEPRLLSSMMLVLALVVDRAPVGVEQQGGERVAAGVRGGHDRVRPGSSCGSRRGSTQVPPVLAARP